MKPIQLLRHESWEFVGFATQKARKQAEKNGEFEEIIIDYVIRAHQHMGRKQIPMVESLVIERMARESIKRREKSKIKKK